MRFSGVIGIREEPQQNSPGVYSENIKEIQISGDVRSQRASWTGSEVPQDIARTSQVISILAPGDLIDSFTDAVYVTWQQTKWTIAHIEYIHPRLNLTLGGKYNGS